MANAWDALLANAMPGSGPHIVNTAPNPDYDQAMGINTNTGDTLQDSMGQLNSILQRNTPQGQQMTMDMAKAKMANQLAIQLMQAKTDLAKANPEYDAHPTPWGSILMTNKYNPDDTHEEGGFPGAKDAYVVQEQAKAATAKTQATPEYQNAVLAEQVGKPALQTAQTNAANAMPELRSAMIGLDTARAAAAGQRATPKWTTEDDTRVQARVFAKNGIDTKNLALAKVMDPAGYAKAVQETEATIASEKAARAAGTTGAAAPQTPDASQAPDVGSMLNLSNGLNSNLMTQ